MTLPATDTIPCPSCRRAVSVTCYSSVNAAESPELKAAVLDGRVFTHNCNHCRAEFPVVFDLLYHDPRIQLAVWLKFPEDDTTPNVDAPSLSHLGYACRQVASLAELVEKIRIFEAHMTDLEVELIKWMFLVRHGRDMSTPLFFDGLDRAFLRGTRLRLVEARIPMSRLTPVPDPLRHHEVRLAALRADLAPFLSRMTTLSKGDHWPHVSTGYVLELLERGGWARQVHGV